MIGSYRRAPDRLRACIDTLLLAGGRTRYDVPEVLSMLRGRVDQLTTQLDDDRALVDRRFPELDFGVTAERRLSLRGATLLHVAAENGLLDAARMLLDRGVDVNALATVDEDGVGGQTPVFHAATQFGDLGLPMVQLLIARGADLSARAKIPGHYERAAEVVVCTPLGYATLFPGTQNKTVELLRDANAVL